VPLAHHGGDGGSTDDDGLPGPATVA
jgi:hypothetical protein